MLERWGFVGRGVAIPLLVLGVLATACSGSSSSSSEAPSQADATSELVQSDDVSGVEDAPLTYEDSDEMIRRVADNLVAAHGAEGGFVAMVLAFERGYDVVQAINGALNDEVESDGHIATDDAGVSPAGPRLGLLVLEDEAAGDAAGIPVQAGDVQLIAFQDEPEPEPILTGIGLFRQLQENTAIFKSGDVENPLREVGLDLIALLAGLASVGYSLEQIINALILGEGRARRFADCPKLETGQRRRTLAPALDGFNEDRWEECNRTLKNESRSDAEEDELEQDFAEEFGPDVAPTVERTGFSGSYVGFVRFGIRFIEGDDPCVVVVPIVVNLALDGSVIGRTTGSPTNFTGSAIDTGGCSLNALDTPISGGWDSDGVLFVGAWDSTLDGSTDGTTLRLTHRSSSAALVKMTVFDACAAINEVDPAEYCPELAAAIETSSDS